MRYSQFCLLLGFSLSLILFVGCGGSSSGPAEPAAAMDEINEFLAENPEQNSDNLEDDAEMEEEEELE